MKLWISETEFIDISERKKLSDEIAPRSRSLDWMGIESFLPDPDPILKKLGQDMTVYRQLLSDAHVWSCCQSRKSGTLSCEWEVRENAAGGKPADKSAYKLITEIMESIDVYQANSDMLDAVFYGMSPLEVIWQAIGGKWIPESVVGKAPEWFCFDPENNLRFKSIDNMIEGEEIPPYKFLLPRHHASYQNPYGERVLSRCFWPVAFKRGGFKFWAIFTEKFGMPWVRGKVPRGTSDTDRARLLDTLTKMVADAVAVINDDESVDITEAAGKSDSADIYERLISASNREISKAVLGQTLTTELDKGGSFAATKEHMEVRADLVDQDKRMVIEAFNRLFGWVVELNLSGAAAPMFCFFQEEDIQKDRSERDTELTNQGVTFTPKYYQRTYNLEEDDFNLRAGAAEQPTAPAGDGEFTETSTPDAVDGFTDRLDKEAAGLIEDFTAPVRRLVQSAKSYEEIRDGLIDLHPNMDAGKLGSLMQQALTAAELSGRFEASEGN